ncbi:MAG: hypothetical protein JO257_11710 [Deltaproteobacteria bacterium]|nr:hypothetical protein [Deltaproteobacteria bacterium]
MAGCADTSDTNARLDDTPLACRPERTVYRIASVDPSLKLAHVIDLDGDGQPDDALGRAHDVIAGAEPSFAVAPRFSARLADDLPWLIATDRCGDEVRVTIDEGMVLPGDSEPRMPELLPRAVGTLRDSVLEARDGQTHVPLGALADVAGTEPARWVTGEALTVRATVLAATSERPAELDGVFAFALDPSVAQGELAPPIATFLTAQPATDWLKAGADGNHDGIVSEQEVAATTPFADATAGDVTVPRLAGPGVSLALRFHAVRLP